ncbi:MULTISPECIES: glycogen debranching protein [Catenuloplanes]|uniref:Glycogen operon protein n=1 Tax=Catenuloplanes niger TaxID=587534 RepID=A0AAE3ZYH4_9ACTN|nr:alpha-amylase family glycosyl hydrolase [Catenuloplanes niger]MDR7327564.1 glycogen operon protein [Catenuloplanes niger]
MTTTLPVGERIGPYEVRPGAPLPFGATEVADGITFSVHSHSAGAMALVLFRTGVREPIATLPFPPHFRRGAVYSMTVVGLSADGLEYGYLVRGEGDDGTDRVLADPYARAFPGRAEWGRPVDPADPYPYRAGVVRSGFDWGDDAPPRIPKHELIVYEAHVRGFTRHPSSRVAAPGTFAGLAEKVPYLRDLGVNCVELMPVLEFDECDNPRHDPASAHRLYNYWGYNTVGFFAPKAAYGTPDDLRRLVRRLHAEGMELLLDVVLNHTAEGDERGPTISFRGLDNAAYYMLTEDGGYRNYSGTGNTFNANDPVARAFLLDCLRYWVTEFHVDGFRFDLASALGRGPDGTPLANPPLLEAIAADPVLRDVTLIAEAWDAAGLYQVGSFPDYGRWAEWNGRYRDALRGFLRGDPGRVGDLATRLVGSPDLYGGRGPASSINFVTAHDGFTLRDLVSYDEKHNDANGEGNRDGDDHNLSWNCGAEGPTDDPQVLALRDRQTRNALLLLLCSHGVPMLQAGDELGRTQLGNNNAYCHDGELTWLDWGPAARDAGLLRFTRDAIAFRRAHPVLHVATHVGDDGDGPVDVSWHGTRPGRPDWSPAARLLAVMLRGAPTPGYGQDIVYLAANTHWEPVEVHLPDLPAGLRWARFADTYDAEPSVPPGWERAVADPARLPVGPRSVVVLTAVPADEEDSR